METCNSNKDDIFNNKEIESARRVIEDFEKNFPKTDYDLIHPTLSDKEKKEKLSQNEIELLGNLKPILLIGLEKLLERYRMSEKNNKGVLRGVLIEQDMLSNL